MIKLEINQQIAWVTLARVEKQNALNFAMFEQLASTIKKIKRNPSLRAVVISGDGEHFCSGLDVTEVMKKPSNIFKLLFKWLPGNKNLAQQVVLGWQDLSIPVIAKVSGHCFGGGLQIALGADYRIVDSNAKLAIMEARWGLCPDMGANVVLSGLMSRDQALWLATHAGPISASDAKEYGLVTQLSKDVDQQTTAMLETIKSRSPDTLAAIKRVTQQSFRAQRRKILAKETISQIRLLLNPNTKKAIAKAKGADDIKFNNAKSW